MFVLIKFFRNLLVLLIKYLILIIQHLYYSLFHDLIFYNDYVLLLKEFLWQIFDHELHM